MGLFSKKTDEQIIEEARALYKKGCLYPSTELTKIARKGNPEACYLFSVIKLESADKEEEERLREFRISVAKEYLEKAVAAGHKEAIALMENRFGGSNGEAKVDTQISNTPANKGNTSKRDAMLEIIGTIKETLKLEPIKNVQTSAVEKFIRNHNLGISLSDVIAYCDTGVFGPGKKGHLLTEEFLYYSDNGKRGTKVEFSGIVSAERPEGYGFCVVYTNGERKTFYYTQFMSFAEYYVKLINAFVAIENKAEEKTESKEHVPVDIEEAVILMGIGQMDEAISILEEYAREGNLTAVYYLACATAETGKYSTALKYAKLVKDGNADDELKQDANELIEEIQAKIDHEKKEKAEAEAREKAEVEEQARIEAERLRAEEEAKAKAEELKRLEEEKEKAEAAARAKAETEEQARIEAERLRAEEEVEQGFLHAQYELTEMYYKVEGREKNPEEAFKWSKLVTELGYVATQYNVYTKYSKLENGNAEIQYNLALMYYKGHEKPEDKKEAFKWYKSAAELGHVVAQYKLALMYEKGEGTEKSYKEAFKWYKSAAEQGYAVAQHKLALMYYKGVGILEDKKEAFKWYKSAVEQGYKDAQSYLEEKHHKGEVVPREVFKWCKAYADIEIEFNARVEPKIEAKMRRIHKERDARIQVTPSASVESEIQSIITITSKKYTHPFSEEEAALYIAANALSKGQYLRAIPYLEYASSFRNAYSAYALTKIYMQEETLDYEKAEYWAEKALEMGHKDASELLRRIWLCASAYYKNRVFDSNNQAVVNNLSEKAYYYYAKSIISFNCEFGFRWMKEYFTKENAELEDLEEACYWAQKGEKIVFHHIRTLSVVYEKGRIGNKGIEYAKKNQLEMAIRCFKDSILLSQEGGLYNLAVVMSLAPSSSRETTERWLSEAKIRGVVVTEREEKDILTRVIRKNNLAQYLKQYNIYFMYY